VRDFLAGVVDDAFVLVNRRRRIHAPARNFRSASLDHDSNDSIADLRVDVVRPFRRRALL
jgi:hypothetical protein